jgi:UDP-3-O-[3-hydroxymyristoyl] glucosamine N-acyltransferase
MMSDTEFFAPTRSFTLGEIADLCKAELAPGAPADRVITGAEALDRAGPGDVSYIETRKFAEAVAHTRAGACFVSSKLDTPLPPAMAVLRVQAPYRAFVTVLQQLYPDAWQPSSLRRGVVAPQAHVDPSARLEEGVTIEAGAVVQADAEIGAGTVIGPNAVIGPRVRIGRNCSIGANATVFHALIGDRVIIHVGVLIGQDGFGYVMGPSGHVRIPQIGRVIIQDGVEIGAGSAIDRGGLRDTVIGEGTKIDNLVQIAHNVSVGRHCVIAAQCGISGSSTLGDFVLLAGQVGVADHVAISEGVQIGAKSGVIGNLGPGTKWMGYPAMPNLEYFRIMAKIRQVTRFKPKSATPDENGES